MAPKHINWLKIVRVLSLHLLFWILVVTYFAWGFGLNVDPRKSFVNALFFLPGHLIMVYTLLYFLVPKFLLKQKFWQFFLGLILLVIVCAWYTVVAQLSINNVRDLKGATLSVGRNVLPFIHVGAIAASIKLLKHWYVQRKQTLEAEQQKTVAELQLLKAQLHPHFLFNTLNNLYSHTLEFSPKSPEIVLKLSGLLRFMIYESNTQKIPLSKEIHLLQDYMALEQLRYGERLDLSVSVDGPIEEYQIVPLLLLPFLENAFKHGTSRQIDQCWISFNISVNDSQLTFKLVNSVDPNSGEEELRLGGIGLKNVIRRLQLLYKDNHHIETIKMEEVFVVNLSITLEKLEDVFVETIAINLKEDFMLCKCIIVDDEPPAIKVLESYISVVPQLQIAATCNNAFEAMNVLNTEKIDLMFLDIHMPKLIGTDLLKALHYPPKVIFTTAHKDFAIEAFELDAIDYLLKPISFERFLKAVNKYCQTNSIETATTAFDQGFLYFRTDRKMVKVFLDHILYIESLKDYILIHRQNEPDLKIKMPIGNVETMLPQHLFIRIHRSFIVALDKITAFTKTDIEIGKFEIPIGRSYASVFEKLNPEHLNLN